MVQWQILTIGRSIVEMVMSHNMEKMKLVKLLFLKEHSTGESLLKRTVLGMLQDLTM